ncbi:hypothetical protein R0290_12940 [Burkholderia semiarida]|nr:hypothetical protein [Burkholderia sp. AU32262]
MLWSALAFAPLPSATLASPVADAELPSAVLSVADAFEFFPRRRCFAPCRVTATKNLQACR